MLSGQQPQRYEALFRQVTPLFLLGVSFVALLGSYLPGADWVAKTFGQNFVLGFCVFMLGLYTLLLWGESLRLHAMMSAVLKELIEFKNRRTAEMQGRPTDQKLEAARLLLPALGSTDAKIAQSARRNLQMLTGKDFGVDVAAWQGWVDEQAAAAGS
jgi:hypothetical protein